MKNSFAELNKIVEDLVFAVSRIHELPLVEKDLLMERLRRVYAHIALCEEVRYEDAGGSGPSGSDVCGRDEETPAPAGITDAKPDAATAAAPDTEPVAEAVMEQFAEPESAAVPDTEPVAAPAAEAVMEPVAEPEHDAAPDTEPVAAPAAETVVEPVAEPDAEPKSDAAPDTEPVAASVDEAVKELFAEPEPDTKPVDEPVAGAVVEQFAVQDVGPGAAPVAERESGAGAAGSEDGAPAEAEMPSGEPAVKWSDSEKSGRYKEFVAAFNGSGLVGNEASKAEERPAPFAEDDLLEFVVAGGRKTPSAPAAQKPAPAGQTNSPVHQTNGGRRSLNDLIHEQREDHSLGNQFQHAKVVDLTKAISINDKFTYIRELFKNRGEEFSAAIQKLNGCVNLEEAFDELENLKRHYYWDSTSNAYLSLCDLLRRKFA